MFVDGHDSLTAIEEAQAFVEALEGQRAAGGIAAARRSTRDHRRPVDLTPPMI
jgi:hypothetical protein